MTIEADALLQQVWDRLPLATRDAIGQQFQLLTDPPPAALYSADPGNGNPGTPWISVDANANLYVYGNLIGQATGTIFVSASGDTTGVTDTANIQAALNNGGVVLLGKGMFWVNTSLTIPPYTALAGQYNTSLVTQHDAGTTIKPVAGFSGITITDSGPVTLNAVIVLLAQTFGGYSTTSECQKLHCLQVDGSSGPAGVDGLVGYGAVGRVNMERVLFSQMTGRGWVEQKSVGGGVPDGWQAETVNARYCGSYGTVTIASDSVYRNCKNSNNAQTTGDCDWLTFATANTFIVDCGSEHSGTIGLGIVCQNSGTDSGRFTVRSWKDDQATTHGCQVGGTLGGFVSFAHATPIDLDDCFWGRSGQNGGGGGNYAGVYVHGYGTSSGGLVNIVGGHTWPGVNDDGSGVLAPHYGIWVDGGSKVSISGFGAFAATGGTAIFDDSSGGANTINYDNTVITGVGATASMVVNMTPAIANYQGASLRLLPASAPATDPLFINNQNAAERSLGTWVVGQNNDRIKILSDGSMQWGPGSATQDAFLARTGVGVLAADSGTDFAVDTEGNGFQVKEGGNGKQGTAQLSSGSVVVSNTSVTANSRIFLTSQSDGGTPGFLRVTARTAGTSFTVTSSSVLDTSTFAYEMFEPA